MLRGLRRLLDTLTFLHETGVWNVVDGGGRMQRKVAGNFWKGRLEEYGNDPWKNMEKRPRGAPAI